MLLKTEQLTHENTPRTSQKIPFVLLCDGVSSPANAGSLFRLADALGIAHIYFMNSVPDLKSNRLKRTSRSCEMRVDFSLVDEPLELIKKLKKENYSIIGLELANNSIPLEAFKSEANKIALVVGNERHGISTAYLELADQLIYIPMHGQNSSMNVGHATAIAAHQLINNLKHG